MPSRPKARSQRVLRGIFWAVLAIVGVATVLLLAAHTPPARRFASNQVIRLLADRQIAVQADELHYNLFSLSFDVRNVRLAAASPDLPPFATIQHARIDLGLVDLLRRRYVVQTGFAEGVRLHYFVNSDGVDNLPWPPADPNRSGQSIDYLIADFGIPNAHVHYEDRSQGLDLVVPQVSLAVRGNALTDRHEIRIQTSDGEIRVRDQSAVLDGLSGTMSVGDEDVNVESLEVRALSSRLELAGTVGPFEAPMTDLRLRAAVDVARAGTLVTRDQPLGGQLALEGTIKGEPALPVIEARVHGAGLQFEDLTDTVLDLTFSYDMAAREGRVSSLRIDGPWGRAAVVGEISLDSTKRSRVAATITEMRVDALSRTLALPYVLASRVDGTIRAEWPGLDYLDATGSADATLKPTVARASASVMPVGGRVVVRAHDGRFDAQLQRLSASGAEMSGQVSVAQDRALDGKLRAEVRDIAALTRALELFLHRPPRSLLPADVEGPLTVAVEIDGTAAAPSVEATANAPALSVAGTPGVALNAEALIDGDRVSIRTADLTWEQARLHLAGSVGIAGSRRLDLMLDASKVDADSVAKAFGMNDAPLAGVISAQAAVEGTMTRPVVKAALSAEALVAYEESLGTLTAELSLVGQELVIQRVELDKPQPGGNGRVGARGSYQLDRRRYTFELQSDGLRLLGLTLPTGERIRGNVRLNGSGSGTLDSPAGQARLTLDSLEMDGLRSPSGSTPASAITTSLGQIAIEAVAADKQATVKGSAERFNLDLHAIVGLNRPWPATMEVRTGGLKLSTLPVTPAALDGSLGMTVNASGNLAEPLRGIATIDVEAFQGTWGGQSFNLSAPARIRYGNEQLAIDRLELAAGDSALKVSGSLPLTPQAGHGEITLDARARLATLAQFLPPETNLTGDGIATLSGTIGGTIEFIHPTLQIAVEEGLILSPQLEPGLSNLTLRARIADGEARIERLDANWGSATIEASGTVPFEALPALPFDVPRKSGPSTFKAAVKGLNPAAIPGAPRGLSGRMALDVQVSTPRAELSALEGRLTFPELSLQFDTLGLEQQRPTAIAIAAGTAILEDARLLGSLGSLAATGSIELGGARTIDVQVDAAVDLGAAAALTDAVQVEGKGNIRLAARGSIESPELDGYVEIADATAVTDEPNIAAEHIHARLDVSGTQIVLSRLTADLNGGTLEGSGRVAVGANGLSDADLRFATDDFAFDAPLELRSLSDSRIGIRTHGDEIIVDGQITIDEAGLTGDFNFDRGLLAAMTAPPELNLTEQRNPLLDRVRFNVDVDTATPIVVDNNVAQAEVAVDVRVVGTAYEPGLTGRVTLLEGAAVTLNERRFEAERGVITFVDERRIQPSFDLLLNTPASNYDITVEVAGVPGETETTMRSNPSLPEPDIMALLVTGRTLDQMRGEEFEVAQEQALSYLAGRVGSPLGRGLERATGLSEVRIEPNLIANEADPSARLTIGQELTDELNFVYSTNLTDSNDQIWVAEYDVTRRFQTRGVRQSDNTYRFDFSHDVRFGGMPEPRRQERSRPIVTAVAVNNETGGNEPQLQQLLKIERGDPYDFFTIRRGLQRVEEHLIETGYLQSRVRLDRQVDAKAADLNVHVRRGPVVQIAFEGATPPPDLQASVRRQWHRGVFDKQRGEAGVEALRSWLVHENHLQPSIDYRVDGPSGDLRRVVFSIRPGPKYQSVALAFEGVSGVDPDRLDRLIETQRLERQLFTDPVVVTELLRRYYREQGYLVAAIDLPRYEFEGTAARVVVPIQEGPRFTVGQVTASGNRAFDGSTLLEQIPLVPGAPFLPSSAERSLDRIRDSYWQRGYNSVRSNYSLTLDELSGRVDVAFTIAEGPQALIAEIAVEGNKETTERLVREQVELSTGEPLDLGLLARSRRNLYDTGAFSIVDITRQELSGDVPATADLPTEPETSEHVPVRLDVSVREVQPWQIRYGASYDTERGIGGILDVSNHNSLGKARVLGLQSRYDRQLREARLYFSQPSLRYFRVKTIASLYFREELNPPTEITSAFDVSRKGASIQQELALRDKYVWTYGYRYERAQTLQPTEPPTLAPPQTVSPLTSTLTRDTRDDVLDASTGSFFSQAFSYSPSWLGSDVPYLKYLGQHFFYFPLRSPQDDGLGGEPERVRWVFATGVRVGLADGFSGGEVPASERFFAGGSTTLRGFAQNAVGPIGPNRVPTGGNALLVLNNELRVPLVSIVDGVVFADIGNAFARISDFSLSDLRESAGIGLRVRTPWFLLRGDYGFVLDRRPGERRSRFYFSIGQAF